jgi:hypothetical protein
VNFDFLFQERIHLQGTGRVSAAATRAHQRTQQLENSTSSISPTTSTSSAMLLAVAGWGRVHQEPAGGSSCWLVTATEVESHHILKKLMQKDAWKMIDFRKISTSTVCSSTGNIASPIIHNISWWDSNKRNCNSYHQFLTSQKIARNSLCSLHAEYLTSDVKFRQCGHSAAHALIVILQWKTSEKHCCRLKRRVSQLSLDHFVTGVWTIHQFSFSYRIFMPVYNS